MYPRYRRRYAYKRRTASSSTRLERILLKRIDDNLKNSAIAVTLNGVWAGYSIAVNDTELITVSIPWVISQQLFPCTLNTALPVIAEYGFVDTGDYIKEDVKHFLYAIDRYVSPVIFYNNDRLGVDINSELKEALINISKATRGVKVEGITIDAMYDVVTRNLVPMKVYMSSRSSFFAYAHLTSLLRKRLPRALQRNGYISLPREMDIVNGLQNKDTYISRRYAVGVVPSSVHVAPLPFNYDTNNREDFFSQHYPDNPPPEVVTVEGVAMITQAESDAQLNALKGEADRAVDDLNGQIKRLKKELAKKNKLIKQQLINPSLRKDFQTTHQDGLEEVSEVEAYTGNTEE